MEMMLRPYPEYRRSGLPWAGIIPAHWETRRAKWLFTRMERPVRPEDGTVTCFRDGVVTLRRNRRTTGFTESVKEIGYQGIRKGDLVIHAMDAFAGAVGVSDSDGKGTPVYVVCEPKTGIDAEYYARVVREMARSQYIAALAKGIRQRSTDFRYAMFAAEGVPMPPPEEQRAISQFLVNWERRANRLVRAKQRLVALLNEQKQATIQRAVTRGLNQDAPLKSSGVEWLGEVPAHWDVMRAKYIYREVDVRSRTGEETHLSMSQKHGLIRSSDLTERAFHSASYIGGKLCNPGDLILNRLKAHLGVFALASEAGLVSPDYSVFRLRRTAEKRYFEYVLRTPLIRGELRKRVKGIVEGLWRLYTPDFYDIQLPVPPVEEQIKIVDGLAVELLGVNEALQKTQSEIELIREYRTRLIADVVTGKLDVRGVAVPEVDDDGPGADLNLSGDDESIPDEEALADASR